MRKALIAGAIVVVAAAAFFVYRSFFGEKVSFETASVSPDGMYRCEVRETYDFGQCKATIKVFHRNGSGDAPWTLVKTEHIRNDSACRSNYSVDWEYDEHYRTERLVVFGDFGTPPFAGEIIFEMRIASGSLASSSTMSTARLGHMAEKGSGTVLPSLPNLRSYPSTLGQ